MFQEKQSGFIEIGRVLKVVGLEGLCSVELYGNTLMNVGLPCQVFLGKDLQNLTSAVIEELTQRNKFIICQFQNVSDRDAAEAIKGLSIFIEQDQLPELDSGEYYHFDLQGLTVYSETGEHLGIVENVSNYPSTDALEVRLNDSSLVVIPFLPDSIIRVDTDRKQIVINKDFLTELL
jgi:16S rRNA processing protein RimM